MPIFTLNRERVPLAFQAGHAGSIPVTRSIEKPLHSKGFSVSRGCPIHTKPRSSVPMRPHVPHHVPRQLRPGRVDGACRARRTKNRDERSRVVVGRAGLAVGRRAAHPGDGPMIGRSAAAS